MTETAQQSAIRYDRDADGVVVLTLDDAVDVASRTKVTATIDASGNWTSGAVALPAGQFGDGPHTWSVTATDAVGMDRVTFPPAGTAGAAPPSRPPPPAP